MATPTKRVYIYKHTKEKLVEWARQHKEELPYFSNNIRTDRDTFPKILEWFVEYTKV